MDRVRLAGPVSPGLNIPPLKARCDNPSDPSGYLIVLVRSCQRSKHHSAADVTVRRPTAWQRAPGRFHPSAALQDPVHNGTVNRRSPGQRQVAAAARQPQIPGVPPVRSDHPKVASSVRTARIHSQMRSRPALYELPAAWPGPALWRLMRRRVPAAGHSAPPPVRTLGRSRPPRDSDAPAAESAPVG